MNMQSLVKAALAGGLLMACPLLFGCSGQHTPAIVDDEPRVGEKIIWLTYYASAPDTGGKLIVESKVSYDKEGKQPFQEAMATAGELQEIFAKRGKADSVIRGINTGKTIHISRLASIENLKKVEPAIFTKLEQARASKNQQKFYDAEDQISELGKYYYRCGDRQDALRITEKTLSSAESFLGKDHYDVAHLLLLVDSAKYEPQYKLGLIDYLQDRQLLERVCKIIEKQNDTKYDGELAFAYMRRAAINEQFPFLDKETISFYNKALGLAERDPRSSKSLLRAALLDRARFYTDKGIHLDQAYKDITKAFALNSPYDSGQDKLSLVYITSRLASTLDNKENEKDRARALELRKKDYEYVVQEYGASDRGTCHMRESLIYAHVSRGQYEEAEKLIKIAIEAQKDPFTKYQLADLLSYIYRSRGNYKDAEAMKLAAIEFHHQQDEASMMRALDRAELQCKLADLYVAEHKFDDARASLARASKLIDEHMIQVKGQAVEPDFVKASSYFTLSTALLQIADGKYGDAVKNLKETRSQLLKFPGVHQKELYECYVYLARAYEKMGDKTQAETTAREAEGLYRYISQPEADVYRKEAASV